MEEERENLSIKDWAEEDRPREKMLRLGSAALSDAELIAILIGSGTRKETAVGLARRVLRSVNNNLNALGKLSIADLTAGFKGIGEAKAVRVCAALELGRRRGAAEADPRAAVRSSHDASLLFQARLRDLPHEELWVALLNPAHRVVRVARISQGGVNNTLADIRLILKAAIDALASGIILCHNHPSGNLQPSRHDDQLTERVQKAAKLMDIALLDNIILADNRYYSYMDEGRLP